MKNDNSMKENNTLASLVQATKELEVIPKAKNMTKGHRTKRSKALLHFEYFRCVNAAILLGSITACFLAIAYGLWSWVLK